MTEIAADIGLDAHHDILETPGHPGGDDGTKL